MVRRFTLAAVLTLLAGNTASAANDLLDGDGDGISDRHEEILGTDPASPDRLQPVLEDGVEPEDRRARPGYDGTKDVLTVELCHAGGDRYLWRATFAQPPTPEDTVFHLYVDGDADESTGRKVSPGAPNHGTEYMLTVAGGTGRSTHYDPEGGSTSGPPVTYVADGNTLLISADVDLGRDTSGVRCDLYVLCHTISATGQSPRMSDSSRKLPIAGVPLSGREKIMRPTDHAENFRVGATFGLDLIRAVLRDESTVKVPHDQLEMDGFSVDLSTSRRWPHVRRDRPAAKVWAPAERAGRYHVGFMMYDDSNDERVAIYIDGVLQGVAVARQDNNDTWLYWLAEPFDFRGGERVEFCGLGSGGKHGICNLLFLPEPPETRTIEYRVENMAAACRVGETGRVTISWTTTWPCPTQFEYGTDADYGRMAKAEGNCLVHRVVLERLDPDVTYHGRAVGTARDGSPFYGDDFVFRAAPAAAPPTVEGVHSVPLTVRNPHAFDVDRWTVTTGVPFPKGKLGSMDHVRLVLEDEEVPLQVRLAGRWPDGSVKWLLATFPAGAAAEGATQYRLEFGRDVRRAAPRGQIEVAESKNGIAVDTGSLRFRIDSHGNLTEVRSGERSLGSRDAACTTVAVDCEGQAYSTDGSNSLLTVEEAGPLRAMITVVSHLESPGGQKLLRIEKRIEAFRDLAMLRVHHTLVVDDPGLFTELDELTYRIPLPSSARGAEVALADGTSIRLGAADSAVRQRLDDQYVVIADGRQSLSKGRIAGSLVAAGEPGCAVALRDFWQNYPKGFAVGGGGINLELCPGFEPGFYDEFPFEKEGHQLYYYLLDGKYRLKRGMAKTHELMLSLEAEDRRDEMCRLFQQPLLATAPPEWYCGTKAFYDVAPRNEEMFGLYERAIDGNLEAYEARRDRQRDYGLMNYGDWYGERGSNWGNVEYDTQHALFLEYIRSGNPKAFFLGEATELHNRDIDTVQWSEDPAGIGAVYVHQMCHVGDYYDRGVPGTLGFPAGGFTVSHAWVEGHFDHYFLTGDRRSYETGCAVADFFTRKQLGRPYDFSTCRTPGWHLIMLAAAYAATDDPYYLNAAKVVVERVLQTQEKEPRPLPDHQCDGRAPYQVGGWSRMMVPGHCRCEPRHRGNAGFMVAILLSGLKYYHDVTGDPRVKEAIIRGAHYLLDETYSDEVHGFRYTSCPNTSYSPGASPLMVEGVARAYLWTGDARFRRVLEEALPRGAGGSGYGKGFSMYYRMAPRVLADLEAAGIKLSAAP